MGLRPRLTDLFALLGLLTLLVSVPSYVAQDGSGEDLSDGWEGTLPKPRDGAYLELEMVATWKGREPVSVGPVWTHQIRAVEPGEVPVDAVFVYERERHPMTVDLGWGVYRADHYVERAYYDAEGRLAWLMEKFPDRDGANPEDVVVEERQWRGTGTGKPLNEWVQVPLTYHPDLSRLAFESFAEGLVRGIEHELFGGDLPRFHTLDSVHEHNGHRLFRLGLDAFDVLSGSDGPCAGCHSDPMEIQPLALTEGQGPEKRLRDDGFEWVSLDWPVPVGPQMWYYDENATDVFLEVAFVPKVLRAGTGPEYDVDYVDPYSFTRPMQAIPVQGASPLPKVPLRDLQEDPRALHKGITIPDLLAAARGDAAPSDVQRFAAEAHLVEFYWVDGEPYTRTVPQEIQTFPLVLPGGPQEELLQVHPMTWFVTLAQEHGERKIVRIDLERAAGELEIVRVVDQCREDAPRHWSLWSVKCGTIRPEKVARERLVADPFPTIDAAARQAGVEAEDLPAFGHLPLVYPERTERGRGLFAVEPQWGIYPDDARFGGLYHDIIDTELSGRAFWRTNQTDGYTTSSLDLKDAGVLSHTVFRSAQPNEVYPTAQTAAPVVTEGLRPLDVVGATALAGGLFLIGLSVLVRFAGWLKAGGSVPLFAAFYAKIARSDVLDHDRRSEIMELVRTDPGVTASEVARGMGYGWGATVHHLETLVRNGFLIGLAASGRRHYFTTNEGTQRWRQELVARRDPQAAAFLDAVAAYPGKTLKELADLLGRKPSGLSRMGSRLEKAGLVRKERDGMSMRFWHTADPGVAATATPQEEAAASGA